MDQAFGHVLELWNGFLAKLPLLVAAVVVVAASYVLGRLIASVVARLIRKLADHRLPAAFFRALIQIFAVLAGLTIALQILGLENVALSLIAGGGVTAIVVGFAFREIGENLLAGLFLAFSRPFNIGDTIRSEDIEGVVQAIDLRNTHLRTADGRDVFVPSAQLFTRPVTNFTRDGLRRISFDVGIDYSHDAEAACRDVRAALADIPGPLDDPPLEVHLSELMPSYVRLTVYFWVNVFDKSRPILPMTDRLMNAARGALRSGGYIVSSEVSTAVDVSYRSSQTDQDG